ncbi:VOC family protein [Zeaxanthinibacter enoshimensis]|uniref:Catechol 2,3-dioxygenase-like lactoylglutathione lyase family enzyme n=1 Tax=Zeaxanthinibacter enoshimensis TaxID=392009 RepID=A0A4R6TKN2_9FLAO|nr:VOC family protein [Zeaxanthinibacter enoshimensis]TDQ31227.1 catechol 2,3-dioxygenase-like lactoylglutathione lyase family enzyme [Zeaxanthinibacter enoshimensis]
MKKFILLLVCFSAFTAYSQTFSFTYDHYSCIVEDVKKTGDFYADVLQLKEIPHPDRAPGFRWFRINGNTQLHLIQKDSVIRTDSKSVHLCLATRELDEFIAYLESRDIPYWDWPGEKGKVTLRSDGVRQIYLKDPEDNWVEINTAEH